MRPSSDTRPDCPESSIYPAQYSSEERDQLIRLAHEAITSACERRELAQFRASEHLCEPRGAFTTLYLHGKLRGCVGYPNAILPLYRTVIETARAAAFEDPRFSPVTLQESRELKISLSILSAVFPVQADEIEVGRHGLVVSMHGRKGLLLPQVATEHGWDRTKFLEQTCRKAGLQNDAWMKGALVEAFTAEVFGEE
jgi:AmmeMemoRadiSam system protein A